MTTWQEQKKLLAQAGLGEDEIELVRRATAPVRHADRVETVRSLLAAAVAGISTSREAWRVLAHLDREGAAGVAGTGFCGCSARIPALTVDPSAPESSRAIIPRHAANSGAAWDEAVAAVAGDGTLSASVVADGSVLLAVVADEMLAWLPASALPASYAPWIRAQLIRAGARDLGTVDWRWPAPVGLLEHWAQALAALAPEEPEE